MHLKAAINQAAVLIQRRCYAEAYLKLREAMEVQERDLRVSQAPDNERIDDDGSLRPLDTLEVVPLNSPGRQMPDEDRMFSFPLVIHEFENTIDGVAWTGSACATLAFNMGLACHLYVKEHSTNLSAQDRTRYLCLAQAFSQQAFYMCKNLALPVLQMALFNNLGEVAMEQNDWDTAKFWGSMLAHWTQHERPLGVSSNLWMHFVEVSSFYLTRLSTTALSVA